MKTIALKNIIDTWNMIEKLNVIAYKEIDATTVEVAECEYNRMLNATKKRVHQEPPQRERNDGRT